MKVAVAVQEADCCFPDRMTMIARQRATQGNRLDLLCMFAVRESLQLSCWPAHVGCTHANDIMSKSCDGMRFVFGTQQPEDRMSFAL